MPDSEWIIQHGHMRFQDGFEAYDLRMLEPRKQPPNSNTWGRRSIATISGITNNCPHLRPSFWGRPARNGRFPQRPSCCKTTMLGPLETSPGSTKAAEWPASAWREAQITVAVLPIPSPPLPSPPPPAAAAHSESAPWSLGLASLRIPLSDLGRLSSVSQCPLTTTRIYLSFARPFCPPARLPAQAKR